MNNKLRKLSNSRYHWLCVSIYIFLLAIDKIISGISSWAILYEDDILLFFHWSPNILCNQLTHNHNTHWWWCSTLNFALTFLFLFLKCSVQYNRRVGTDAIHRCQWHRQCMDYFLHWDFAFGPREICRTIFYQEMVLILRWKLSYRLLSRNGTFAQIEIFKLILWKSVASFSVLG